MRILILLSLLSLLFNSCQHSEYKMEIKAFQDTINAEYADTAQSPLLKEDLTVFKGLEFYPIDEKYKVKASFERVSNAVPFTMKTTTDRAPVYEKYAKVKFELDGKTIVLFVYQSHRLRDMEEYKNYLSLPFKDLTCGKTSYEGGRYVDLKIPKGNTIIIDFNKSYNPYCAYNHKYSCVIPPAENFIDVEIKAGTMKYGKH